MRCRLIALLALTFSNAVSAAPSLASEQDLSAGRLIFEVAQAKFSAPATDHELRGTLGSAMEFLFLQLQRSKSEGARVAAARTVAIDCDAGCARSQQDAILSKGPLIEKDLRIVLADYDKLCGKYANICLSKEMVFTTVEKHIKTLRSGRWKVKP